MDARRGWRRLKRLAWLGAIVGTVAGVRKAVLARRGTTQVGPPPTWPPLEVGEAPVAAVGDLVTGGAGAHPDRRPSSLANVVAEGAVPDPEDTAPVATAELAWIAADAGQCPLSHPIKANSSSRIYHVPGSRFYDRTKAERCYADAAAAEADGYRAAKSSGSETS
jgi:hypothetical protein